MSEALRARLANAQQANTWLNTAYSKLKPYLLTGHSFDVVIKAETRSTGQNRAMWAALHDVAAQVVWHGQKLSAEDWKHIFSAGLRKQRVAPGLDGGFVVLGQSTRAFTKAEMSDMLELIQAFGAERGVRFSAPEYEEA